MLRGWDSAIKNYYGDGEILHSITHRNSLYSELFETTCRLRLPRSFLYKCTLQSFAFSVFDFTTKICAGILGSHKHFITIANGHSDAEKELFECTKLVTYP